MREQIIRNEPGLPSPFRLLILEDTSTDAELEQLTLRKAGLAFDAQVVANEADFLAAAVDFFTALGMAKEGFDWIWCEHALTVGYRASLTEIVQIIGRATRDAPGKTRARFTNLIAEPDASEEAVTEAVNDTLKEESYAAE